MAKKMNAGLAAYLAKKKGTSKVAPTKVVKKAGRKK